MPVAAVISAAVTREHGSAAPAATLTAPEGASAAEGAETTGATAGESAFPGSDLFWPPEFWPPEFWPPEFWPPELLHAVAPASTAIATTVIPAILMARSSNSAASPVAGRAGSPD